MLTRRRFMELSGATALSSICIPPAFAETDASFCTTFYDEPPTGEPMAVTGSTSEPFSIQMRSGHVGEFHLTEYGLSVAPKRWRKSDGRTKNTGLITLGVHFHDASAADRALVERGATAWLTNGIEKLIAFEFGVPQNEAQISILFDQGVNDSKIGRDSQAAARSSFSMRIQDRADYIVTHEFGHALCLKHEHQHPDSGIVWDKPKVIADLARLGVTDPAVIKHNIFDPLDRSMICAASPDFNAQSIMSYQIPRGWDKNGFTSTIPHQLSDGDIACVYGLYHG